MAKLIECVPNFSEGRRPEVIEAICKAITEEDGVVLLDHEMDPDHNRAVVTFVCDPKLAVDAAFRGIKKASELIDMSTHHGEHPRMGACDVCPFIPLGDTTIEDAIEIANKLGQKVGDELQIPIYMYEDAATTPKRKNLATVRKGEYEGIRDSIETDKSRKPDYGPSKMNIKSGATAVGVRFPLVAFNVYLDTNKKWIADNIADAIRSIRGGYKFVKALGFEIKERNQVQISMNLVNYTKTPIFRVFETIKSEANRYGVNVTSSEIIGLVPNDAIVDIADFYMRFEGFSKDQILEEKLKGASTSGSADSFYDDVASSSPAPGGGSVAASAGALSAALTAMVCRLTVSKKQYADVKDELSNIRDLSDPLKDELEELIVTDMNAFNDVMTAFKTKDENQIEEATKKAAMVPLTVMQKSLEVLKMAEIVANKGNENSVTDAGVAGLMGMAAIEGAGYNVKINLTSLNDTVFVDNMTKEANALISQGKEIAERIKARVESCL